jgi:hypothetical protein
MEADDLTAPLGQNRRPQPRRSFQISGFQLFIAGAALLALILLVRMITVDEPVSGETALAPPPTTPIAAAPASRSEPTALYRAEQTAELPRSAEESPANDSTAADAPGNRTITIIDGTSGKRREVVIPDTASMDQQQAVTTRRGAARTGPAGIPLGSLPPAR